ncbi:MAG: hypothetical protein QXG82_05755 [Sulfolobales archaeon]
MSGGRTRLNDGSVAIRSERTHLPLEVGSVIPADVAPNDSAIGEQELRAKLLNNVCNYL